MDLSKAKTVLIITFLILNIFLFYQILLDKAGGNTALFGRKEEMSRLETALQEAGLVLEVTLPKGGIYLSYMIVEPWRFTPEEIIFSLWKALEGEEMLPEGEVILQESRDENLTAYFFGEYELLVSKEGLVTLKINRGQKEVEQAQVDFSMEQYQQAAQEFNSKVSFFNNLIYDYSQKKGNVVLLNYRQEYEEFPLFAGYLRLYMKGDTPDELVFYRLEPIGFTEHKREIIPPSTALLRFIESYPQKNAKRSIVEFSLGFYSKQYDAERWEIPPVWRIRLENDEIYYINAFNGILEQ